MIQLVVNLVIFCWHVILIVFVSAEDAISNNSQFTAVNDCTCLEYNSVYECTVTGGIATVWKGTAFDCQSADNEVVLLHNTNFTSLTAETCNNGAITGQIIGVENGTYTSKLVVRISAEINGSTIVCAHDTGIDTPVINSTVLTITQAPFPPPTDIQLVEANYTHLSFNWTQVSLNCPSLQYHIMASNCGECPNTTTNNIVTCTGNYASNCQCLFAVQTVVCNDSIVGNTSTAITVTNSEAEDSNPTMAENGGRFVNDSIDLQLLISVIVASAIILMGTTLVLGLVLVYLISKKSSRAKSTRNQRSMPEANMVEIELSTAQDQIQATRMQQSLAEHADQNLNLRSTGDIIYTDVGPNIAKVSQQNFTFDDCVQYEEIRHSTEPTVCEAPLCDAMSINLDLLLILLKEDITPRWYEFGLVVGVPKEVMDNYLGYPSDQCLIELLDYWLRHHPGQLTWREVAQALREIKLYQLSEKALQISATGKFTIDPDISRRNLATEHNPPPVSLHIPMNHSAAASLKVISTLEYEDTAGLLPPPLPPKDLGTQ